jgi:D-serine deaminase-like pyridoxal phosphate-dependent protein
MSSFPNFSNIAPHVIAELSSRKGDIMKVSNLNAWVRVASGVGGGCQLISNPNFSLFGAAGSIYGNNDLSGTIGYSWDLGKFVVAPDFHGYRPKPNITSIEVDEGSGNISRKATFSITCYTRAQLDEMCKYFLEPGYTIFLEWGWNTTSGVSQFVPALSGDSVGANQSFQTVNNKRKASNGHYDNYLGFITGGSVSMSGQEWTISVKCTGFTELPAFLNAADNTEGKDEKTAEAAKAYDVSKISAEPDLGKQRFMMGFNRLPSNKQSVKVQDLITDAFYASPLNFVNVDENVKAEMNSKMKGTSFLGFKFGGGATTADAGTDAKTVDLPEGTDLIGDSGFIKFGVLSGILSQIGFEAYKIGPNLVSVSVNTKNTVCAAFPKIFSTDKNKLFIPNPNTPKFSLLQASENTAQTDFSSVINCSVEHGGARVRFPYDQPIVKGSVAGRTPGKIQHGDDGTFLGLNKPALAYGFLDDLYVNLEFAKGILETKNFSIKDALYQLLNGMSGAACGLWDFQIIETTADGGSSELSVVDMNMAPQTSGTPYRFDVAGSDSIFMDASLDLDISGAKMNQIIGNRLGQKMNGSSPSTESSKKAGLFTNEPDLVLTSIKKKQATTVTTTKAPTAAQQEAAAEAEEEAVKKAKEKAMQLFLSRIGYAPKVHLLPNADFNQELEAMTYITAYNDQLVFESLKNGKDVVGEAQGVSALMPIKFSFTIHGVSGIKRGDKFRVGGIPKAYEETGFFQVTSVKQTITDMIWKTEIEGGFRLQPNKK